MRVLIAAGGTAGHINPALAIAGALKKADPTAEIHFAGRKEGMEYRLVTQAGYPFHHIEITGFQRKLSLHNIKRNIITLWNLALSGPKAKAIMKEVQPDLVIGCGGVARTMAYEVVLKKQPLLFAVRKEDLKIAEALCDEIRKTVAGCDVSSCLIDELSGDIDVLVNATPIGMFPKIENQPVSDSVINRCANVFDAVYNPLETMLVKKARANGATAESGMAMLVWQAVVSHEHWDGSVYDKGDIAQLCIDSAKELEKNF